MMNHLKLEGKHLGQYEVRQLLRVGSLTETYKAVQPALDRPVMVKVLKSEFQVDPSHRDAFRLGARIHAGLEHPHLVPIHDCDGSPR